VTKNTQRDRGFTLIEILVALALMAMIATILVSSLQIGGHTWQRVMRSSSNTDDIAQAQEFFRVHLTSLYPEQRAHASGSEASFLVSNGNSLEFLAVAPNSNAGGVARYQVFVSPNSGALEVRVRDDQDQQPDPLAPEAKSERLLSHVASLTIQFWLKPDDAPGHWVDHWSDASRVPRLIRIDVAFTQPDNRSWPRLYVESRVDAPANCVFDVINRRCRGNI
jgi:general secretion pathway protein J